MILVGITGTLGAGKGTIVDCLKEKGFAHYSVRDFLVEEIEKRGLEVNRDSMTEVANSLRKEHGADYIVRCIEQKALTKGVNCVIESIRNPKEVELLRKSVTFYLVGKNSCAKSELFKKAFAIRKRWSC